MWVILSNGGLPPAPLGSTYKDVSIGFLNISHGAKRNPHLQIYYNI